MFYCQCKTSCWCCYPPFLGITNEMMSQGPQVASMENREADEQAGAPTIPHITIRSMVAASTTPNLAHRGQQVLLHEVTSPVSW
jgi:hypothetical protein